ncbi:PKD domain-containing protein, partial [Bacteroidales bacterium]|nr:PKD domain-containing protein [Bacteroidales bacterium]
IANAGTDQTVDEGTIVTLDGSASSDEDGNTLTYLWTAPSGITLSNTKAPMPTFTAPYITSDTMLTFTLTVNDGYNNSIENNIIISVSNILNNVTPIANAGRDQSVNKGILVTLDGSLSFDSNGDLLTYLWSAPDGITLSDNSIVNPTFIAPNVSSDIILSFKLFVSNSTTHSKADEVLIKVKGNQINIIPLANAGYQQTVEEGSLVSLDGSLSNDEDGDPLLYTWSAPEGITLSDSNSVNPTFYAPNVANDTTLTFELVVNDGIENSQKDIVLINISNITWIQNHNTFSLSAYPNPSKGQFNISSNMNINAEIINMLGKTIEKIHLIPGNNQIDISEYGEGLYILITQDMHTIKLNIQK